MQRYWLRLRSTLSTSLVIFKVSTSCIIITKYVLICFVEKNEIVYSENNLKMLRKDCIFFQEKQNIFWHWHLSEFLTTAKSFFLWNGKVNHCSSLWAFNWEEKVNIFNLLHKCLCKKSSTVIIVPNFCGHGSSFNDLTFQNFSFFWKSFAILVTCLGECLECLREFSVASRWYWIVNHN